MEIHPSLYILYPTGPCYPQPNRKGGTLVENMTPNPNIQCGVCSCTYHDPSNHCCLTRISVEPLPGKNTGMADESKCASYRCRQ